MTSLLGISGSLRRDSSNTKLIREAARLFGPADFVEADLRLPLYDGDLEARGIPPEVQTLSDQIAAADAVVIATPEYNKAPSGVLKNALDWVSRTEGNPWRGKPVALISSAAGRAGGERSQFALRLMMVPFRARVLPGPEVMVAGADAGFGENGELVDPGALKLLGSLMKALKAEIARS